MTTEQIEICKWLGQVSYLPASFDKRLGKNLSFIANNTPETELTDKQNEWMYRLLYKYRKQIYSVYDKYKNNPLCSRLKN